MDRTAVPERPEPTGKERWPYEPSAATPKQRQQALVEAKRILEQMKELQARLVFCELYLMQDGSEDDAQWLAGIGADALMWADEIFYRQGITRPMWGVIRATLGVPEPEAQTKKRS